MTSRPDGQNVTVSASFLVWISSKLYHICVFPISVQKFACNLTHLSLGDTTPKGSSYGAILHVPAGWWLVVVMRLTKQRQYSLLPDVRWSHPGRCYNVQTNFVIRDFETGRLIRKIVNNIEVIFFYMNNFLGNLI